MLLSFCGELVLNDDDLSGDGRTDFLRSDRCKEAIASVADSARCGPVSGCRCENFDVETAGDYRWT